MAKNDDFDNLTVSGTDVSTIADLDTHAGLSSDVHGIADTDTIAGLSDLSTHAGLASDVHGIADTDTIAGQSDIDTHASAVEDVHGIAAGDAVAAQSAVDAKADDPHDNTAHSTAYSAEGHDHSGETLLPDSVHYQTLTADPAAPADGAIVYHFDDGTDEQLRAINSAGEVITLGTFA